jgi:hypothetical protein
MQIGQGFPKTDSTSCTLQSAAADGNSAQMGEISSAVKPSAAPGSSLSKAIGSNDRRSTGLLLRQVRRS